MDPVSSASDQPGMRWEYIRPGLGRTGRSLSENNFQKETRDWIAILLREVLQNALDARTSPDAPVTVYLSHRSLDDSAQGWMSSIVDGEHLKRFEASMPHVKDEPPTTPMSCLVIEDFGTSGLTGSVDNPNLDGKGQNWNAFWFREGEGGKENTSGNGGAGQGKITYFSTSAIRTIFAYTVSADDQSEALMGACSFLRDYDFDGHKWKRDAYWGVGKGEHVDRIVLPTRSQGAIESFRGHLQLRRQPNQSGLSLVIPQPRQFDQGVALQVVIAEFFVPLLRGDLAVWIDDIGINKTTVVALANQVLSDERARELHTCMTRGYREFLEVAVARSSGNSVVKAKTLSKVGDIKDALFEPDELLTMKEAIDNAEIVSVRFPVVIKSRLDGAQDCSFDVHLACPSELDRPEQAVIRRDLLIGEEPIGSGKLRQRARGLTIVGNDALSRLLLSAEEATHLRWNTRLPRLAEYYKAGNDAVAVVRNAMTKLLEVLTGGEQKRDFKLLAKYFSAPGLDSPLKIKGKSNKKGKETPLPPIDIPPPKARLLALEALEDGCRVRSAKTDALSADLLPLEGRVEFAYEGLDKDPFNEYDPLDFDLAADGFDVAATGCTVNQLSLNRLDFTVVAPDFELRVSGFDKNLRLRMRLNYDEVGNAAPIDAV